MGAFAIALGALGAAQAAEPIYVQLDQAKIARLPASAVTLIIGNPMIADVTMLKVSGTMVITGKSFGETNLVALDKNGELVAESPIRVRGGDSVLVVQRGAERESYSCSPECRFTPQLGDSQKLFVSTTTQIQQRNQMSQPGGSR